VPTGRMQFDKIAGLAASYSLLPCASRRSAGTHPAKASSTRHHSYSLCCERLSAPIVDFPNVPREETLHPVARLRNGIQNRERPTDD
jgi:hypothetical protein